MKQTKKTEKKYFKSKNEDLYRKPIVRSMLCRNPTAAQLYKIIRNINSNKAPGIDGIRSIDIKLIAEKISEVIAYFIDRSLHTGRYPSQLKTGLVRRIFNGGDTKNCFNCMLITMLPILDVI